MAADYDRHTAEPVGARRLQMPLDEDVIRLAKGKNLATVVTLMPSGQPQALLTWIDTDGEDAKVVWRAVCDTFNVPERLR